MNTTTTKIDTTTLARIEIALGRPSILSAAEIASLVADAIVAIGDRRVAWGDATDRHRLNVLGEYGTPEGYISWTGHGWMVWPLAGVGITAEHDQFARANGLHFIRSLLPSLRFARNSYPQPKWIDGQSNDDGE